MKFFGYYYYPYDTNKKFAYWSSWNKNLNPSKNSKEAEDKLISKLTERSWNFKEKRGRTIIMVKKEQHLDSYNQTHREMHVRVVPDIPGKEKWIEPRN
jgi:hypothetical protein